MASALLLGGSGTYNLTAGALIVPGIQGAGGIFNLGGGTLVASAGFSTSQAMILTGSGGNGNINSSGYAVKLSGPISGTGGLSDLGAGTLTLAASNTFSGETTISAGSISLNNANALKNSTVAVSINNSLLFNSNGGTITTFNVGGLAGSGNISLADGSHAVTLSAGGNGAGTTYSGVLSSSGGLTKAGSGILFLSGVNTYTGSTTISAGTLAIGGTGVLGGGNYAKAISDSGALLVDTSVNQTFGGVISGSGALYQLGSGLTALTSTNTYSGGTTINGGGLLLNFAASGARPATFFPVLAALRLGGGSLSVTAKSGSSSAQTVGALTLNAGSSGIVLSANGGTASLTTGSLTVNGAAILTIANSAHTSVTIGNTWSPGSGASLLINLTGGTLASMPVGSGQLIGGWVTVLDSYGVGLGMVNSSGDVVSAVSSSTILPPSAATSSINYWLGGGTSSQTVTASETGNSLSLIPGVSGGSLTISTGTLGFTANTLSFDGTNYSYSISGSGQLGSSGSTLTVNTAGGNALTVAAPISSGSGGLTVLGSGTVILAASNSYTGITTIGGCTLQLGNGVSNGSVAGNVADGGSLIFANPAAQTFAGTISGNGGLTVSGTALLALTASNTYAGGTTITAGTLSIGGGGVLGNGNYAAAIANSGTLLYNSSAAQVLSGLISGTGSLIEAGAGMLTLQGSNTYSGPTMINGGVLMAGAFRNALRQLRDHGQQRRHAGHLRLSQYGRVVERHRQRWVKPWPGQHSHRQRHRRPARHAEPLRLRYAWELFVGYLPQREWDLQQLHGPRPQFELRPAL